MSSIPVAIHFDRAGGIELEREETREVFIIDALPLEVIAEYLMTNMLPQIRRNYRITDLVKDEDGQYQVTFERNVSPATEGAGT